MATELEREVSPQMRLMWAMYKYPRFTSWTLGECAIHLKIKQRDTYRLLKELHRKGFITTKTGKWKFWRVFLCTETFELAEFGKILLGLA